MTYHEELAKRARETFRDHVTEDGRMDVASAWLAVARAIVPEGWAVVPVEPTPEMVRAHAEAMHGITTVEDVLRAALAAAPSP